MTATSLPAITLTLDQPSVEIILRALGTQPLSVALPVFTAVQQQALSQLQQANADAAAQLQNQNQNQEAKTQGYEYQTNGMNGRDHA
jgi:hypothetical protein